MSQSRLDQTLGALAWLLENTSLTSEQARAYAGAPGLLMDSVANGRLKPTHVNLLLSGYLTQPDIDAAQRDKHMPLPVSPKFDRSLRMSPPTRWVDPLDHERVTDVRFVKLFFAAYGRNAWHSTWIKRYLSQGSVCASLEIAKDVAERGRNPGTVWGIDEIPGMLIQTNRRSFAVTEINDNNQSLLLSDSIGKLTYWQDVLNLKSRFAPNSIACVMSPKPISLPALHEETFLRHYAVANGSKARLGWRVQSYAPNNVGAVQACVAKMQRFIGASDEGDVEVRISR